MKYRFWNIVFTAFTVAVLNDAAVAQTVTFENVATVMGVQHMYVNHTFYGGGVSFADFDGDGRDDLTFATGEGEALMIYRNVDSNTFTEVGAALNVTDNLESKTVLWVDYDNDGDRDLFIANYYGSSKLFANQNGVFADVTTAAGLIAEDLTTIAACWADFNNDGWLDVYLTNHSPAIDNVLFQSNGDGTFTDVTAAAGVADAGKNPLDAVKRMREAMNFLCEYVKSQQYDLKFALEAKPNEPRGDIFLATTGHMLAFIETLDHADMVGVNPEMAHEHMAGLNFLHNIAQAWDAGKLFHIDLNDQNFARYDQDFRFGSHNYKQAFFLVKFLEDVGYAGSRHFDAHAYRSEDVDGVKDFARGCMRTYLILKDKAAKYKADAEIQALLKEIHAEHSEASSLLGVFDPQKADTLKKHPFDRKAISEVGLKYEKLDQLVFDLLMGIR